MPPNNNPVDSLDVMILSHAPINTAGPHNHINSAVNKFLNAETEFNSVSVIIASAPMSNSQPTAAK